MKWTSLLAQGWTKIPGAQQYLHNHNRMAATPDPIKLTRSVEESKESPDVYSIGVLGATDTGGGSFALQCADATSE